MNIKLKLLKVNNIFKYYSNAEIGCIAFCTLMFTIFPVIFMRDFYFSLNQVKLSFLIAMELVLLVFVIMETINSDNKLISTAKQNIILTDIIIFSLFIVTAVSGLASEFFPDTLGGVTGRYNGVIIMILYTFMYFILRRYLNHFSEIIFVLFAISSFFVYLLGILNFFSIDVFDAFINIKSEERELFISTIGNRNFFSSFICLSLPVFMVMFCKVKSKTLLILYAIVMLIGFFALFCSNSDSGFIAIYVILGCMSVLIIKNIDGFRRYLVCLLFLFLSGSLFGYIQNAFRSFASIHSPISKHFINNGIFNIFTLFMMFILLLTFLKIVGNFIELNLKKISYVILILYIVFIVVIVFLFIWYSIVDTSSDLDDIGKYFRFSDNWGSFRGSAWIYLISIVPKLNIFQLFFGTGPDTIYQVLSKYYLDEIQSEKLLSFDSAHNEYLHYFITTGIIGVLLYILLIVTVLYYGFKMYRKTIFSLACTLSILCYCVQGFFNISMVSTTPLLFLMITLVASQYSNYMLKLNDY